MEREIESMGMCVRESGEVIEGTERETRQNVKSHQRRIITNNLSYHHKQRTNPTHKEYCPHTHTHTTHYYTTHIICLILTSSAAFKVSFNIFMMMELKRNMIDEIFLLIAHQIGKPKHQKRTLVGLHKFCN